MHYTLCHPGCKSVHGAIIGPHSLLITKINRAVGSVLVFQQSEPQNRQEFVTLMNNKAVAISKMMELPG